MANIGNYPRREGGTSKNSWPPSGSFDDFLPRVSVFPNNQSRLLGFNNDLSDGGIFVATYDLLPIGSSLSVSFVLPGGHPVTAKGRVSWVREPLPDGDAHPGMGVVFDGLAPEDQSAVMEFIAHRSPLFHEG